jgi:hypothetical protein
VATAFGGLKIKKTTYRDHNGYRLYQHEPRFRATRARFREKISWSIRCREGFRRTKHFRLEFCPNIRSHVKRGAATAPHEPKSQFESSATYKSSRLDLFSRLIYAKAPRPIPTHHFVTPSPWEGRPNRNVELSRSAETQTDRHVEAPALMPQLIKTARTPAKSHRHSRCGESTIL